jgi:antitoxin component of RelBE/YafQ-DinJ toxin-antitoxin module
MITTRTISFRTHKDDEKEFSKICATVGITKCEALRNLLSSFLEMYSDDMEIARQVIQK